MLFLPRFELPEILMLTSSVLLVAAIIYVI
jgi:hypothetical protein